jgi:predicted PurR-regulated permease PerM
VSSVPQPRVITLSEGFSLDAPQIFLGDRRSSRGYDVGSFVRGGVWLLLLLLSVWFLSRLHFTLVIFGLAWLIAYLLNPVIAALEGRRLGPLAHCPRPIAVFVLYLLLFAIAAFGGSMLMPMLTGQINHLVTLQQTFYDPHQLAAKIQEHGTKLVELVPEEYRARLLERLRASLGTITTEVGDGVAFGLSHLAEFLGQMVAGALIFMSAMLISIYMLLNWRQLDRTVVRAFPRRYRGDVRDMMSQMNRIFGGYLRATILTSLCCTVCSWLALLLFGLVTGRSCPYSGIISIVVGLTYPIPMFGILSSTIVAALLAFVPESNFATAFEAGCIVLVVNSVIDRTLLPKLMSHAIGVSPLFVIFAAAAGGEFMGGVWGMLLGIPVAAMLKALFVWFHGNFLAGPEWDRRPSVATTTEFRTYTLTGDETVNWV